MTENYFLKRRSCRNFKPEKIAPEKLDEMIIKAMKAPTCGNMQLYSMVVTQEEENLKKLATLHYNQPAATTAPLILTVCADFNRFSQWCSLNKATAGFNNFHSFMMAMTDAVILTQQIVTVAETEGYATCYLGTVTYNATEISELLKLPELVVPVASIAIGIPREDGGKTERLPLEGIMHFENYKTNSDQEIKEIYKIFDENADNQKFIKENHKDNLAQVFAEVRYPVETNEKISESFLQLLKHKGFLH